MMRRELLCKRYDAGDAGDANLDESDESNRSIILVVFYTRLLKR